MPSSLSKGRRMSAQRRPSGTERQAGPFLREASSTGRFRGAKYVQTGERAVNRERKHCIRGRRRRRRSSGWHGAHGSGGPGGSAFGKPAVENSTFRGLRARSPCIGAVAVMPTTGAPLPNAPASNTNPSPTNGLAVGGTVQSNPDLPRLTQQDEGIIAAIKLANEKLGEVGNPPHRRIDRQPSRPASVIETNDGIRRNDGIQRRDSGRSRARSGSTSTGRFFFS
jgi:hypothetical protein